MKKKNNQTKRPLIFLLLCLLLSIGILASCDSTFVDSEDIPAPSGTEIQGPEPLIRAISEAILSQLDGYSPGEKRTEGHFILSIEENSDGTMVVYAIASCNWYCFGNNTFTAVSGSGAIPAVIKFSKKGDGYELISYTEPMDGSLYAESIKELFPEKLWASAFAADKYYPELKKQQEEQAKAYLITAAENNEIIEQFKYKITGDTVERIQ